MRGLIIIPAMIALVGCSTVDPSAPVKVSWQYGAGNGDGVAYPGPAPIYKRAYGLDADEVSPSGATPTVNYGYGAENQTGTMVQVAPPSSQQVASPAPTQRAAPRGDEHPAAPGTHS